MLRTRRIVGVVWLLVAGFVVLISLLNLWGSIDNAHYDPHENRSPGAIVALAVVTTLVSVAALRAAVRWRRTEPGHRGALGGGLLTVMAYFLLLLDAVVEIASGPL